MGPLQAMLEEEEALKEKLKERRASAMAAGYERRSLLDPNTARESVQKSREARRASAPELQLAGPPSARIESLMRPTAMSQIREAAAANKRNGIPEEPVKEMPEVVEETEEQKAKWEKFHHRSTIFQQDREKYLEKLRIKQEEKEMKGCTFKPAPRKSAAQVNSSCSMFDRARQMEIKKQERIAKIRQELFDKEMAQCSFQPRIVPHAGAPLVERVQPCYDPSSRRPSASGSDRPSTGQYATGQFAPARCSSATRSYGNRRPSASGNSSEGSEYWDGNTESRDADVVSQASAPQEEVYSEDVTILPNAGAKAPARPPLPPSYCGGPSAAEQEAQQLKVLQRLQERRQLLEETLSPDKNHPAPFNFSGANQFSAAIRQRSSSVCVQAPETQKDAGARRSSAPAAAVAEAVERMEDLLLGNYDELSDLEDSDLSLEEWQDGEEDSEESEDELADLGVLEAEAPVLGGKPRKVLPPPSPTRGGC